MSVSSNEGAHYRWTLYGDVVAEVAFSGPYTSADIELLQDYLGLVKRARLRETHVPPAQRDEFISDPSVDLQEERD